MDQLVGEGGRVPRADARRNVERLVVAARAAVAEVGIDVTAHEIARRAGVGIGTFYRRVSSREALLEAVLAELLAESREVGERALADPDPWHGFVEFATAFTQLRAACMGITEALGRPCGAQVDNVVGDLRRQIRTMVSRAQEAGLMRADLSWRDVPFLLAGAAPPNVTLALTADDQQWHRVLGVVLDGLRTPEPSPLPGKPPRDSSKPPHTGDHSR